MGTHVVGKWKRSYYKQSLKVGSAWETREEAQTSESPSLCSSTSIGASWGGFGIWSGVLPHLSRGKRSSREETRRVPAPIQQRSARVFFLEGAEGGIRGAPRQPLRRIMSQIPMMQPDVRSTADAFSVSSSSFTPFSIFQNQPFCIFELQRKVLESTDLIGQRTQRVQPATNNHWADTCAGKRMIENHLLNPDVQ